MDSSPCRGVRLEHAVVDTCRIASVFLPGRAMLALGLLAFSGCSPASKPDRPEAEAPADMVAPAAPAEPAEASEDPTLQDLTVPEGVEYRPSDPLPAATPPAAEETPSAFWYDDIPESREEQVAMKQRLDAEYRQLHLELARLRQEALQADPQLAAQREAIEAARARRAGLLASAPEVRGLAEAQQQRMDRLAGLDREAKALLDEVKKEAEFNPELLAKPHPVESGCCGFHKPESPKEETILDRYHAKLAEYRATLMEVSRHALERGQLERELSSRNPQLGEVDQEIARNQAAYRSVLESRPELRGLQRQLDELNEKRLYLGRVIMGDTSYFTPSENESSPN